MNKNIINKIDKDNMSDVIIDFYKHIEHSFDIIKSSSIDCDIKVNSIVICGMGGSAIGGDFVKTVLYKKINIPIIVNRDYSLPKWVNKNTLIILCSYSGNTEETISCLHESEKLKINPMIISSGGTLLNRAIKKGYSYIQVPSGIQPRAAFGYSSSLLLLLLNEINIAENSIIDNLYSSIDEIKKLSVIYSNINDNNAIELASKIYNKFPIIYGTPTTDIVSLRFRCQLAENTKILASHFTIPEHNHNEIEGFEKIYNNNYVLIWIYDSNDNSKNIKRIKISSKVINHSVNEQYVFKGEGDNLIVRLLKLIYFYDWVSFYGAIYNNINPTPVNKILELKSLMKK